VIGNQGDDNFGTINGDRIVFLVHELTGGSHSFILVRVPDQKEQPAPNPGGATGRAGSISFPTLTPTPYSVPADPEPGSLTSALVGYTWSWNDTNVNYHTKMIFLKNGVFHSSPTGNANHWLVTSSRTISVVLDNGYKTTLTFDKSFKTYTNHHQMSGTRLEKRAEQ
jgi:hypothetical protein